MVPLFAAVEASPQDLAPYLPVILALILGAFIAALIIGLVGWWGTRTPLTPTKAMPFEAGSVPIGTARHRVHVQYYVVALLFIVFDLETVFLFVWAPVFRELGAYGLTVMSFFLVLLVVGLAYEWKKGALEWAKSEE